MQLNYIMTVTGPFEPQILSELARVTRQFDAEWVNTQVIRIEQQFCAMMKIGVDPDKDADLKAALTSAFPKFSFIYSGFIPESTEQTYELVLELLSPDRRGLTKVINDIFAKLAIEIIQQQSLREHQETVFSHLSPTQDKHETYHAQYRLSMPKHVTQRDLLSQLRTIDANIKLHLMN